MEPSPGAPVNSVMPAIAPINEFTEARATSQTAPVAAGRLGLTIVPSGAMIVTGLKNPSLMGQCGSIMHFSVLNTVASVDAIGQFVGPCACSDVPVKSTRNDSFSTLHFTWIL